MHLPKDGEQYGHGSAQSFCLRQSFPQTAGRLEGVSHQDIGTPNIPVAPEPEKAVKSPTAAMNNTTRKTAILPLFCIFTVCHPYYKRVSAKSTFL
jgi:hypothetical protein